MSNTGHGDRLSAIDASFLQLESPHAHMHVAWSSILTPPTDGAGPTVDALRKRAESRLGWVPRCRQRLLAAPFGVGEPRWIDDEDFDIANHIVQVAGPGEQLSPARLGAIRDALLSMPLDRRRPLWQLAVVPRLEDGRMAIIGRVHHALADGAAAFQLATLVLDLDGGAESNAAPTAAPARWRPAPAPSALERALDPLVHGAELTRRAARDVARACERPRTTARGMWRDAGRAAQALAEDLLPRAPGSELNGALGPRRTLVQHRVALDRLRAITRRHGVTRNDVGLAAVAGALRALALECGAPAEPLKALVPVNMRRPDELGALGNRVSLTAVWLPLDVASPRARLLRVRSQTERFKHGSRAQGAQTVMAGLGLLPSPLRSSILRAVAPSRFNLIVSNVPGPPVALHMLGARLDEIYPVIPIAEDQALAVGMLSYADHLHLGLHTDPNALPQGAWLAELVDDELRELERAGAPPRSRPSAPPAPARTTAAPLAAAGLRRGDTP